MSRRTGLRLFLAFALVAGLYALVGFVLLPALIERRAPAYAAERLGAELSLGDARFNPFLLRLEASDLRLVQEAQSEPMLTLERLVVDVDWSSLWARTWNVSDLRLDGARARVEIGADGRVNWAALAERDETAEEQPPPRVRIRHATVHASRLAVADLRGGKPASAALGDIEIEAFDLATLPGEADAESRYKLSASLPGAGTLQAQGSLSLQPVPSSAGTFELAGLSVPESWLLLSGPLGLDVEPPAATMSGKARYAYSASPGTPALTLDAAELQFEDVALRPSGSKTPLLRLGTLVVQEGRLDLAARELAFAEIRLNDGALLLNQDDAGRLDWQALGRPPSSQAASKAPAPAPAAAVAHNDRPWRVHAKVLRVEGVALQATDRSRPVPLALDVAAINGATALALDFGAGPTRVRLGALTARLDDPKLTAIGAGEPLLALETLSLAGAALDSGERRIEVGEIAAKGGSAALALAENGSLGLVQALRSRNAEPPPAKPTEPSSGVVASPAWRYTINTVRAEGLALLLRYAGVEPAIEYRTDVAALTLGNVASAADTPMRLEARLGLADGASLAVKGSVAQGGTSGEAELLLDRLPLLPLQPLLAREARLELRSGLLSARARLELRDGEGTGLALRATGSATVSALRVDETESGDRFLSWQSLQADDIVLDTSPGRLAIREITLQEPGAKLVIAKDRSVNLTQVMRDDAEASPSGTAGGPQEPRKPPTPPPFEVAIERIRLQRGVLDYADLSLVLPFSTRVTALQGTVLGVTTARGQRARVRAAGEIERFGSARVNGSLLPFAPTEFLDLRVRMDNVAMPPLSPYTATFAGRKVAEGKLWLDLDYRIEKQQLLGDNKIRLADFRLGERVEAPSALDLPLDLAVALLTDEQGRIEVAVPVRGNVGDPKFDLGAVFGEALGSVLKRVVSAPFRALGRLFGGEDGKQQFAEIEFRPGSDELMPPQREKLEELARALAQRPQLRLVVSGTYSPERDTQALRRREARRELARSLGEELAPGAAPGPIAFESERTQRALEALFARYAGEQALHELRAKPREPAPASSGAEPGQASRDAVPNGLYRGMFDRIAQSIPLPDAAVQGLATRRADAIRDYLTGTAGATADRVKTGPIEPVPEADTRTVSTRLALDAIASPATAQNTGRGAARP